MQCWQLHGRLDTTTSQTLVWLGGTEVSTEHISWNFAVPLTGFPLLVSWINVQSHKEYNQDKSQTAGYTLPWSQQQTTQYVSPYNKCPCFSVVHLHLPHMISRQYHLVSFTEVGSNFYRLFMHLVTMRHQAQVCAQVVLSHFPLHNELILSCQPLQAGEWN